MFGYKNTGAKGHAIVTSLDGHTREYDTLQCVHCGGHWVVQPGSGKKRGFCLKCTGPLCGKKRCFRCVPFEKSLEILEGRRLPSLSSYFSSL